MSATKWGGGSLSRPPAQSSLLATGPQALSWGELELPVPTSSEVVVRTSVVGVCGTDLEMMRHGSRRLSYPAALGHEWVGTVVAVQQPEQRHLLDRLVVGENRSRSGGHIVELGFERPGAMAGHFLVPAAGLIPLHDSVSRFDAVLAEPTAVSLHAVTRLGEAPTQVAIIGAGPIGLIAAILATDLGHDVTLIGKSGPRLDRARELGIEVSTWDSARTPAESDWTACIEASGDPGATQWAVQTLPEWGVLVLAGGYPSGAMIDVDLIQNKNLRVQGVNAAEGFLQGAVDAITSGVVTAEKVGTHSVTRLAAIPEICELLGHRSSVTKLVIDFEA